MESFYYGDFPVQGDFATSGLGGNAAAAEAFTNAFMVGYFSMIGLFLLAGYIITAYSMMKVSVKTGRGRPWFAWIPVLRTILWLNIGGFSGWYIFALLLLLCIPFLGWLVLGLFYVYVWARISVACGKPGYLAVFIVAPMASILLPLYLAFSEKIEQV